MIRLQNGLDHFNLVFQRIIFRAEPEASKWFFFTKRLPSIASQIVSPPGYLDTMRPGHVQDGACRRDGHPKTWLT
jgi:hypothetical protein